MEQVLEESVQSRIVEMRENVKINIMINFDDPTEENRQEQNSSWL